MEKTSHGEDNSWREYHDTRDPALKEGLILEYVDQWVTNLAGRRYAELNKSQRRKLDFDDLAQTGSEIAFRECDGYDPDKGARFSTWMFYKVDRGIRALIRSQGRRSAHENELTENSLNNLIDESDPAEKCEENEQLDRLRNLFGNGVLTQGQKQVVISYYFLGQTDREIALERGVRYNGIWLMRQRALEKLRKHLNPAA